jgi:hypothetical protein
MDNKSGPEKQAPPTKKRMSDFRKGLLWTAIPILVLSAIGAGGTMAKSSPVVYGAFSVVAYGLWGLAILACIGFAIAHKRQIAIGILAGIGIGVVGLGLTCFATMSNTG